MASSLSLPLTPSQREVIEAPLQGRLFLAGSAGTGKTTAGVERLQFLLTQGVPASSILMLTPQRTTQEPYLNLLHSPQRKAGGEATPATIGGIARRMCDLFWPLAAEPAGFKQPAQPPVFLTLETAQYYMAYLVRPLLDSGYFQSVTMDRNRLYSQLIDNLNKSAIVGFPHTEIGARMDGAWFGDPAQRHLYQDVQYCANLFRAFCLEHNLLDFSLQLEVFSTVLWRQPQVRDYLQRAYHHLIYDNVEEDTPRAHDLIGEWLPYFDSALLIYDTGAGYRNFLGGDSQTGAALSQLCEFQVEFDQGFVSTPEISTLSSMLVDSINHRELTSHDFNNAINFILARFYPEMLDAVIAKIGQLIEQEGISPSDIVILAPYLSDALRFSITHRLEEAGIPWRSHRPSRSLRDEPASGTLLTLAALAHPSWNLHPTMFEIAQALMFTLNTDLVRARLLAEAAYRPQDLSLSPFEAIKPNMQERITYRVGGRYNMLREWLMENRQASPPPLDLFLRQLFGEVLSQPEFGFHQNLDAVRVAASLIESIQKFRQVMEPVYEGESNSTEAFNLGQEYIRMLEEGVIAAQYLESWRTIPGTSVLVAPAHTFLLMNQAVDVQFWLDPGSNGWVQRLAQPLTHPYVLSRHWEAGRLWTDADEVTAETESLARLTAGLLSRCRKKVFLALADLGETGYEQRGVLLRAFQRILQQQEK